MIYSSLKHFKAADEGIDAAVAVPDDLEDCQRNVETLSTGYWDEQQAHLVEEKVNIQLNFLHYCDYLTLLHLLQNVAVVDQLQRSIPVSYYILQTTIIVISKFRINYYN